MNRLKILAGTILIMLGLLTVTLGMGYAQDGDVNNDNAMIGNGSNQPTPPVLMPEGTITQVFVNGTEDGSMVVSHMVGNTTLNIEIHPPTEEKEVIDTVIFEITAATLNCNSLTTTAYLNHVPENFGSAYSDAHIWRSNSDFIDFGGLSETGRIGADYLILNMSINEDMTEFTGHGVISNTHGFLCYKERYSPLEDVLFPLQITGTCGAGTSYTNDAGVIVHTPGTFFLEGLSSNGFNVTATSPDFYSYCYRQ